MLAFDPGPHLYTWHGKPVASVTQIIASALGNAFANVPAQVLAHKRDIGVAAHLACDLDDRGDLDEDSVHPEVRPYLEAWRAFRRELEFDVLLSELPLYHETHGYSGTPDRAILLKSQRAVVDLKTGLPGARAGLQTAAYAELIDSQLGHDGPWRRFALQALPNGRYKFTEYTNPGDWRDFLACLAVHRLKERIE